MTEEGNAGEQREQLHEHINKYCDGKQIAFAENLGLSPSMISGWLNPSSGKEIPKSVLTIISQRKDLENKIREIRSLRAGRVVELNPGFGIVCFNDEVSPGVLIARGISDLKTATGIVEALLSRFERIERDGTTNSISINEVGGADEKAHS